MLCKHISKGVRPLFFKGNMLYCARYNNIIATDNFGQTFSTIGELRTPNRFKSLSANSALARRILRMSVYRLRVADNGNIVCVFKGGGLSSPER